MTRRVVLGTCAGLGAAALVWLVLLSPAVLGRGGSGASGPGAAGSGPAGSGLAGSGPGSGVAGARYLGLVAPSAQIPFGLSLRMRSAAMGRYATAVQQGRAPSLDAAQIGRHFGVSGRRLAGVRALLRRRRRAGAARPFRSGPRCSCARPRPRCSGCSGCGWRAT